MIDCFEDKYFFHKFLILRHSHFARCGSGADEFHKAPCIQCDTGFALLNITSVSPHIALQFIRDPALHWTASLTSSKGASNWIRQESVLGLILFNIFIKELKDGIRMDSYSIIVHIRL